MEFFEKAHCKKSRNSENTKLQIKQMITAYKQNNFEGIRESADTKFLSEDSTLSFNSFSDEESNVVQNNNTSDKKDYSDTSSVSCVEDLNLTNSTDNNSIDNDSSVQVINPVSCYDSSDSAGMASSILSSDNELSTRISSPEAFDQEGTLAKQIKQKLMQKVSYDRKESLEPLNKRKKKKLDNLTKQINSWTIEDVTPSLPTLSSRGSHYIQEKQLSEDSHESNASNCSDSFNYSGVLQDMEYSDKDDDEEQCEENSGHDMVHEVVDNELVDTFSTHSESSYSDIAIPIEDDPSAPPFTTFVAPDFDDERLSEVFEGYNFIPIKGLPFQTQSDLPCSKFFTSDIEAKDDDEQNSPKISEYAECQDETFDMTCNSPEILNEDIPSDTENQVINNVSMDTTIDVTVAEPDNVKVYKTQDACILVLKHPCTLYIRGKLQVLSLGGTAKLFGYTLKNQYVNVLIPNHSVTFSLTTIQKDYNYYGMYSKLIEAGLPGMDAEDIVVGLGEYDVILKLKELKFNGIDFVQKNFKLTNLFGYKPNPYVERRLSEVSGFLNSSLSVLPPSVRTFDECPTYQQIVEPKFDYRRSLVTPKGIVCGGKGSGKSTFVRYFVNQMLDGSSPVLVIDLDPGQAEFTPAGTVSAIVVSKPLLGPNYTHLQTPERSYNVSAIDVFDNLNLYKDCVNNLIAYCKSNSQYKSMPWIVNTMGLCNSVGLSIITKIILSIEPTFVLQYDSKIPRNRYSIKLDSLGVKQYYENQSKNMKREVYAEIHNICRRLNYEHYVSIKYTERIEVKKQFSLPPKEYRYLNFLAYFGQLLDQRRTKDLLSIIPYEVPLNKLKIGSNVAFDQDHLLKILNGKIVALCEDQDSEPKRSIIILKKDPLVCHGYGIIRYIDMSKELLYVLTPISMETLGSVNTMVYCDWIPELRVEEESFPGVAMPYRTMTPYNQKQLMFTPKRRFNPIQFFKLARKQ